MDNVGPDVKQASSYTLQPLSLRRNFSWTLVGNILYAACQSAMLIVLAKIGSTQMVGEFVLALTITAPPILFASALRGMQGTDARRDFRFADYMTVRLLVLVVATGAIAGIALCSHYATQAVRIIAMVTFAKLFDSLSDGIYGLLQQHERMDRIAISRILQGALQLLTMAVIVHTTGSLFLATAVMAAASGLVTFLYDAPNAAAVLRQEAHRIEGVIPASRALSSRTPNTRFVVLTRLTRLMLPFGMVMLLLQINTSLPRYLIERYLSTRELGVFAALAYVTVAGSTVMTALTSSVAPRLSQYYAAGDIRAFRILLAKLLKVGLVFGGGGLLVAICAGRPVLRLLYTAEYARHNSVFVWLMVVSLVTYMAGFFGGGLTAARYFSMQLPQLGCTVFIGFLAGIWLIPAYGLLGAAWSMLASMLTHLLIGIGLLAHALRERQAASAQGS